MRSRLLTGKLRELFGGDGEAAVKQQLAAAAASAPTLATGVPRLLDYADQLLTQFASVQRVQAELSGDAFSDWNLATGRVDSGKRWKALLGYAETALDDTIAAWRRLVFPDDLESFDAALAAHIAAGTPTFEVECRLQAAAGGQRWLLLRGKVVSRDAVGKPTRLLLLQRDVTASRQSAADALSAKEAAEAANRAQAYFMANVSHEIRTPMNGIIGMIELALDTRLDAEQRHYLRTVKSSAEALLAIVNDILDFSKIEAGRLRFESIPFSPAALVLETVRAQAVEAHRKGLEVIVEVAPDLPARLIGDPTRLRQVLANLVGNAVKFTDAGEISVSVGVEQQSIGDAVLRFAVRDTGIGIAASRQSAIFEAFSQADDSTTRRFGGTGLGLTICNHLVQMMGGRVWLESARGEGSCFYFSARFAVDRVAGALPPEVRFPGRRALVVERNASVGAQLVAYLEQAGIQASALQSAEAALEAIARARTLGFAYDFVLVDARMPAPGGMALAEAWAEGERAERLIMLLTTEQQRQSLKHLREIGVHAHLVKPVAPEDLVDALQLATTQVPEPAQLLDPFDFSEPAETQATRPRVLLVEDNPVNQELADRVLKNRGCVVTLAHNGAEAVDCFEKQSFDLIFMDVQMPVMDGIEATESIRSRELRRSWVVSRDFKPVYIVAMTASAMDGDRERCLAAGMDDYLAKPIRPDDVYAAIDRGLGGARALPATPRPAAREVASGLDLDAAMRDLGDRQLLQTMARMFVSEWDEHLSRIECSLARKNAPQLCMDAHTVKSLLAIFHGESARRIALDLEHAAKRGEGVDWAGCEDLAGALEAEMARLKPAIERFVRSDVRG